MNGISERVIAGSGYGGEDFMLLALTSRSMITNSLQFEIKWSEPS